MVRRAFLYKKKPFNLTAINKLEEGEDDVKSAWPLWAGLHTCYNGNYNEKQWCEPEQSITVALVRIVGCNSPT